MHSIGPTTQADIEKVSSQLVAEGMIAAQALGWKAIAQIRERIAPGMEETEATRIAQEIITDLGSPRAWHRPLVRFGSNTTKTFSDRSDAVILGEADIYFLDIGPNWVLPEFGGLEYESDVGDTFAVGNDPRLKACEMTCRELFSWASAYWKERRPKGPELYAALERETEARGYRLLSKADGHRLSEFPHNQYSRKGLTEIDFCPSPYVWVLEVQIATHDLSYGAFFEDILRP